MPLRIFDTQLGAQGMEGIGELRHCLDSRQVHWVAAKHVLKYLRGTMEYGLRYLGGDGVRMQGHSNLDWEGNAVDRKSTVGCYFSLGLTVITWFSNKQTSIVLDSAEAEYMACSTASCEAIWLCKLLTGLFDQELEPTVIYCVVSNSLRI
jgi:hypothetical protein